MDDNSINQLSQLEKDLHFMRLAINQANLSEPVETAYCVGAVLVDTSTSQVLSTGYSRELPGNTHAEECAISKYLSSISDSGSPPPASLQNTTIYTTMEPCSKRLSGKKSCVERILEMGIKRVVLGIKEPDLFVKCEGIELLREKGVVVFRVEGLEEECLKPNQHVMK